MSNFNKLYLDTDHISQIEKIALSDYPILIIGKSGVGKDFLAEKIHYKSKYSEKKPVYVDLTSIPIDLLEKELFGAVKGAYTGLKDDYHGKFQSADNNSIILDGISTLPTNIQGKLLRVLDKGYINPLGSNVDIKINSRIITMTSDNILGLVEQGEFRKDLYYRINTFEIEIPSLLDRKYLIKNIIYDYLVSINYAENLDFQVEQALINYNWPGNIRELINVLERAIVLSEGKKITLDSLLLSSDFTSKISGKKLKDAIIEFKREYIARELDKNGYNISKTSIELGIQRTYLSRIIKELNIK